MKRILCIWIAGLMAVCVARAEPVQTEPANPELSPEARELLTYLQGIYGKKTLSAISGSKNIEPIHAVCGKTPAVVGFDLSGWNSPPWGESYNKVVEETLTEIKAWHARGGIVTMQCHWIHPSNPDGSAWISAHGRKTASPPFNFTEALQPGTAAHTQFMRDLKNHADVLERLAEAHIPVLWRPFHEIDGGWFWWTDQQTPENTAAAWQMMFNYFVKERKLNNLIWVYNCALRCGKGKAGLDALEMRGRYYPGDAFVDIAGIDVYPSEYIGIGSPQTDAYKISFDLISKLAPNKMVALSECDAIPNPDLMESSKAQWLYAMPWWGPGKRHPEEWIKKTYCDERLITLDELPNWTTSTNFIPLAPDSAHRDSGLIPK